MIWLWITQSKAARWAGAALGLLLAIVTFGASRKRQGRKEAYDDIQDKDRARADGVRERVRGVDGVQPSDIKYRD